MLTLGEFSPDSRWLLALHMESPAAAGFQAVASSFGGAAAHSLLSKTTQKPWSADVWDIQSGQRHMQIGGSSNPTTHTFSRDGRYLAIGMVNGTIRLWDMEGGEELFDWHPFGDHPEESFVPNHFAFTADSTSLAIPHSASPALRTLSLTRINEQLNEVSLDW
jgi:WD40 repeat protein